MDQLHTDDHEKWQNAYDNVMFEGKNILRALHNNNFPPRRCHHLGCHSA